MKNHIQISAMFANESETKKAADYIQSHQSFQEYCKKIEASGPRLLIVGEYQLDGVLL